MSQSLSAFDLDLNYGEAAENQLRDLLGNSGRIEVKRSSQAHYTGNVFVELASHGEPAGLETTQADWWAFALDDSMGRISRIVLVPVSRLRALVSTETRRLYAGDRDRSYGALVKLTDLVKPL